MEEFNDASKLLNKCVLSSGDWKKILSNVKEGDLVYLDPPYYVDSSSKFVGYTDPVFGENQHDEMIRIIYELYEKNVKILLSNSNSNEFNEKITEKFKNNYEKIEINTNRSINPNSNKKHKFIETLYIFKKGENYE